MQMLFSILSVLLLWQKSRGSNLGATIISVLLLGSVLLFFVGLIYFIYTRRTNRIKDLQTFAAQNGWQHIPNAGINFFKNSGNYSVFSFGHHKEIEFLMQRQYGSGQMFLFHYHTQYGQSLTDQTVIGFHSPRLNLPYFNLYPDSLANIINKGLGRNDIDFASHPNFSQRYKLRGENEMLIRQTFHPQMLSNFEHLPSVSMEGGGNYIFIYDRSKTIKAENLNGFINERMNFVNLFAV